MKRLNQMLDDAINGTFQESAFNETELSRLESRWKQYLSLSGKSVAQAEKERENLKKLVSDISHQTRTPLSSILLYAELMEDAAETESTKELARQILSQTKKLEFLIQALVKMSRLETDILFSGFPHSPWPRRPVPQRRGFFCRAGPRRLPGGGGAGKNPFCG